MTAQATQSSTALGRRSSPTSFFSPLSPIQTLGLQAQRPYAESLEEQGTFTESIDAGPMRRPGSGEARREGLAFGNLGADAPADATGEAPLEVSRSANDLAHAAPPPVSFTAPREGKSFAEVARRVWSEAAPGSSPRKPVSPEPNGEAFRQQELRVQDVRVQDVRVQDAETTESASDAVAAASAGLREAAWPQFDAPRPGVSEVHALAHDASNLLSALRLYSELLCFSGVLHERHLHYAEDLKLLSLRSETLIGRLMKLAGQVAEAEIAASAAVPASSSISCTDGGQAGDATSAPVTPEVASLSQVLARLTGVLGTIAGGALQVDSGFDATVEDLPVRITVEALERILVNLVSNAAVAVGTSGAIRIRTAVRRDLTEGGSPAVVLTVDDSGCGMSDAQIKAALGGTALNGNVAGSNLDPALSVPVIRRHGLGLSIVRGLVENSAGRLFIQSRPGTGTRIEIHWDAQRSEATEPARAVAAPAGLLRPVLAPVFHPGPGPAANPAGIPAAMSGVRIGPGVSSSLPGRPSGLINGSLAQAGIRRSGFTPDAEGAVA